MDTEAVARPGWLARWSRQLIQVGLAIRILVASTLTFALCHLIGLQQPQWAVVTAIIVMQASVGASLKAATDRIVGSLGGAAWGVIVSLAVPRGDVTALGIALGVGVAPLALLVAWKPAYRVAPITAAILLLTPSVQPDAPFLAGMLRMLEISIGSVVAFGVSLLVLPARAQDSLRPAVGHALRLLAELMDHLPGNMRGTADSRTFQSLHDRLRKAIAEAESIADEMGRERRTYLTHAPDPQPICRTLRRIRNDLVMFGRATSGPFPGQEGEEVVRLTYDTAGKIARYLRVAGTAICDRDPPPPLTDVQDAIAAHAAAITRMRQSGTTRTLPDDVVSRLFSLGFALDQLYRNLTDLEDRVRESSDKSRQNRDGKRGRRRRN